MVPPNVVSSKYFSQDLSIGMFSSANGGCTSPENRPRNTFQRGVFNRRFLRCKEKSAVFFLFFFE